MQLTAGLFILHLNPIRISNRRFYGKSRRRPHKDRKYSYHVFVTNLELDAWRVYLFYNGRANIEKSNREFLYDYPLGKIPTQSWTANVAFFQLVLLAANLVHWFKRLCLSERYATATVETIRTDLLVLPAKLVRGKGRNLVKLPRDYPHCEEFQCAKRRIAALSLPKKFRICPKPDHSLRRARAQSVKKP